MFLAFYEYARKTVQPFHPLLMVALLVGIGVAVFLWRGGSGLFSPEAAHPLTGEEKMVILSHLDDESMPVSKEEKALMLDAVAGESRGGDTAAQSESDVSAANQEKLRTLHSLNAQ